MRHIVLSLLCMTALMLSGCGVKSVTPLNMGNMNSNKHIQSIVHMQQKIKCPDLMRFLWAQHAGKYLDRTDQQIIEQAIFKQRVDHKMSWYNSYTRISYHVMLTAIYQDQSGLCRDFTFASKVDGHSYYTKARVCYINKTNTYKLYT